MSQRIATALGLTILLLSYPCSVQAEPLVVGEQNALRVEVRDASVEEVLAALQERFGLRYRSNVSLDRNVTGTYTGSLQQVATHLLEGYDFVIKTNSATIEVIVLGLNRSPPPAATIRRRAD